MPRTGAYQTFNGVRVRERRLTDGLFQTLADKPDFERDYVGFIRKYVDSGETVVIIGGHYGVSTVVAAECVGDAGQVLMFEATGEGVERVTRTVRLNGVDDRVEIQQAIVGPVYQLYGRDVNTSPQLAPGNLPECDVLAIDCDGCELELLEHVGNAAETVIVEHHGEDPRMDELRFEYQRETLEETLRTNGYDIVNECVYGRTLGGFPDTHGVFVAKRY